MAACLPRSPLPMTPPGSRRVLVKPAASSESLERPVANWKVLGEPVTNWGVSRAWGWEVRGQGSSPGMAGSRAFRMEPEEARVGAAPGVGASLDREGPRESTTSDGGRGRSPGQKNGALGGPAWGLHSLLENCLSITRAPLALSASLQRMRASPPLWPEGGAVCVLEGQEEPWRAPSGREAAARASGGQEKEQLVFLKARKKHGAHPPAEKLQLAPVEARRRRSPCP